MEIKTKMAQAFLDSLKTGDVAIALNGVKLTYMGLSSDKHNYLFDVPGHDQPKVYNKEGVGMALGPRLALDLAASMAARDAAKEVARTTGQKATMTSHWLLSGIQAGVIKPGSMLFRKGAAKADAIYKGISKSGMAIFSMGTYGTAEYMANGELFKHAETVGKPSALICPLEVRSLAKVDLFDNLVEGSSVVCFDGTRGVVTGVTESPRRISVSFGERKALYNGRGVLADLDNVSGSEAIRQTLVSTKDFGVELPKARVLRPMIELRPHVFVSEDYKRRMDNPKEATNLKLTSKPKQVVNKPVQPVTEEVKKELLRTPEVMEQPVVEVKDTAPAVQGIVNVVKDVVSTIESLFEKKSALLVMTKQGVIKVLSADDDHEFETTMAANASPGTETFLVKVEIVGSAIAPLPKAVFRSL